MRTQRTISPAVGLTWQEKVFTSLTMLTFSVVACFCVTHAKANDEISLLRVPAHYKFDETYEALKSEAKLRNSEKVELYVWNFYPGEADSVNACTWLQAQGLKAHSAITTSAGFRETAYSCVLAEFQEGISRDWLLKIKSSLVELDRAFGGKQKEWMFYFSPDGEALDIS